MVQPIEQAINMFLAIFSYLPFAIRALIYLSLSLTLICWAFRLLQSMR